MKIEKINENSIQMLIDKEELMKRNIKISDLSYGSEKSKELFIELFNIAKSELDFIVDSPVAIEVIPLKEGNMKIIITKVYEPDELDSRFSRFTPMQNDFMPMSIMQLLETTIDRFEDAIKMGSVKGIGSVNNVDKLEIRSDKETVCIFEFDDIDAASDAAKNVSGFKYDSVLYKDEKNSKYFLVISINSDLPKENLLEFNKICNTIAEYGTKIEGQIGMSKAYYDEHYKIIIKENAITKLSML